MAKAQRGANAPRFDADGRPYIRVAGARANPVTIPTVTVSGAATYTSQAVECADAKVAILHFDLTAFVLAATEEIDIYIQTTFNGEDWFDIRNIHFDDGDEPGGGIWHGVVVIVGLPADDTPVVTETASLTDAALADDTAIDLPLGIALRFKAKGTNTGPDAVIDCNVVLK